MERNELPKISMQNIIIILSYDDTSK